MSCGENHSDNFSASATELNCCDFHPKTLLCWHGMGLDTSLLVTCSSSSQKQGLVRTCNCNLGCHPKIIFPLLVCNSIDQCLYNSQNNIGKEHHNCVLICLALKLWMHIGPWTTRTSYNKIIAEQVVHITEKAIQNEWFKDGYCWPSDCVCFILNCSYIYQWHLCQYDFFKRLVLELLLHIVILYFHMWIDSDFVKWMPMIF